MTRISGMVGPLRGGYEFSVAATPEPAEWMLLLAGLVGLGFIARRKIGLVAGAPA
jgi:MYXO-CTERM domain-containing protein